MLSTDRYNLSKLHSASYKSFYIIIFFSLFVFLFVGLFVFRFVFFCILFSDFWQTTDHSYLSCLLDWIKSTKWFYNCLYYKECHIKWLIFHSSFFLSNFYNIILKIVFCVTYKRNMPVDSFNNYLDITFSGSVILAPYYQILTTRKETKE